MFIYRKIQVYLQALLLHRLRSLLSTLGVLFGVVAVITMLSIGEGAKQETLEQIEKLGMNNIIIRQLAMSEAQRVQALEQKSQILSWRDVEVLRQNVPMLIRDAPLKVVEAAITGASLSFVPEVLAVTRHFGEMKELQLSEGRLICDLDQKEKRRVCVLGYEVAKDFGRGGHVGCKIRLDHRDYEVVGVLKSVYWKAGKNQLITMRHFDTTIFVPLSSGIDLANGVTELSEIILQIQDTQHISMTVSLIKKILSDLHGGYEGYQIIVPQELLQQAYHTQRTFNWVLGSIAGISLLVGGVGIMNIMLANVSERTREIGIRRAVGASQKHILLQFLSETLLLTFIGAILGIIVGIGLSILVSLIADWRTIVTPWSILLSLVVSSVVGLCSGLYPAYQAARMDPVEALHRL